MTQQLSKQMIAIYQPIELIGGGAYGFVWKVQKRKQKTTYALKKNFDAFQNDTDAQRTYREIMFLKQLKHPNIIKMQQVHKAQNDKDIYILFELMDIDLYTLIRQNLLGNKHKRYIAYQCALAIHYMHCVGLIHRDIKPSNVLVNENCSAKICDFGLVRSVHQIAKQSNQQILTEYIATRWYRAPELLLGSKKYTKSIDVWSFGCLLGQMMKGKPLFPGNSTLNQIQRVLHWTGPPSYSDLQSLKTNFGRQLLQLLNKIKPVPRKQFISDKNNCPDQFLDLISKCLQFNPDKRPSMQQILKHTYFKEFYKQQHLKFNLKQQKIFIWDQEKLSTKQYRKMIYNDIFRDHSKSKALKTQESNNISNKTPSQLMSMQASITENKRTIENNSQLNQKKTANLGASEYPSQKPNYRQFNKKPRTVSGKKKYGSVLYKSPDQSKRKYIKTEQKVDYHKNPYVISRKNSNNIKLICSNMTKQKPIETRPSTKDNLEKNKKGSQGLARFFYRRGHQIF